MALLIINSKEYAERLQNFEITCKGCGSTKVAIDIDWSSCPSCGSVRVMTICTECHRDEELLDVGV